MRNSQRIAISIVFVVGLVHCETTRPGESILKDTIDIYSNTYRDKYGRNQLLALYKSKCDWHDKIQYNNCIRAVASAWSLGEQIDETSNVRNVCCFFWDVLDCAKKHTCKPLWEEMFTFYLKHQLKDQCEKYPYDKHWDKNSPFNVCETDRKKPKENAFSRLTKDEEPVLYGFRKEIQHMFRKAFNS